jgi:hypothetical protein
MNRPLLAASLAAACACTETIRFGDDPLANLVELEVTPGDAIVTLTALGPPHHTLQLEAMGRFADGSMRDITGLVTWSADNTLLGGFSAPGVYVASHAAGGRTTLVASAGQLTARAALTIVIDATIIDSNFPPPAPNLFDPASPVVTGHADSPALAYPSDGTMMPYAIARTLFQYTPGAAAQDAFQLRFDSDVLHLVVETGADRWEADGALQRLLAGSGLGGPLRVSVRATSSNGPAAVYGSTTTVLAFSQDRPGGALYYWSAAATGIMRGALDATTATKLYPPGNTCVGCHALSRDSRSLAMGYDSGAGTFSLQAIDVATLATTISAADRRPMGWATYSPDGTRMVVANHGALAEHDARTGALITTIALPATRYATHPDWSRDGTYIAVALTNQQPDDLDVKAASIARIAYNDGAWGAPVTLVAGSPSSNQFFPRWSPDSRFIAYVSASSSSQNATSAELMLVDAAGGTPRALTRANRSIGSSDMLDVANTMPAWGPEIGERAWLAFVSIRPYGKLLPRGLRQLWITSLDLAALEDGSTPAFWLPCQDLTVVNYNPAWAGELITQ